MLYCPKAEQPMLSMMKLLGEGANVTFRGTNCILVFPGGCILHGTAVNNLLHLTDYGRESHMAAIMTRAQSRKETSKNGDDGIGDRENGGEEIMEIMDLDSFQPISDSELDEVISPTVSSTEIEEPRPLSLKQLWHHRLAHSSTSIISKIPSIKSTYDSSKCISCIRAKHHRRPLHKSNFKATKKVQYIHSDLSGPHILSLGKIKSYT